MAPWLIWTLAIIGPTVVLLAVFLVIDVGFRPTRDPNDVHPQDLGLPSRDVALTAVNGKRLAAWYIPPPPGVQRPAPAVAVMHGWGSNRSQLLPVVAPLHTAGYALLLLDSRCHGDSEQDSFASMPRFAEDLSTGVDWLRTHPEVDRDRIAVFGHSVGACAALLTASRRSDLVGAVSLSAFADPETVMRRFMERVRVPYRPLGWLVNRYVEWRIGWRFRDIAPKNTIRRALCPVLLLHGEDDRMVPVADAYAIHGNRRTEEDVELVIYTRCDHDSVERIEVATPTINAFLARVTGGGPRWQRPGPQGAATPVTQPA
ncbi:alpha/beta hydrolase [Caenispirillum bisanense]|uniref:Serine aminopeptidase, S33 n=1 Tax=Caenispirillum bisanense TaxID=414052 RepID=A0A286GVC9_9PROT|nr:alpha/beta fold hydrolase [Caenispirillum bisanense]SOD99136.1 Serine aminopeptidase, S33 [Caenispirillum bisanense]